MKLKTIFFLTVSFIVLPIICITFFKKELSTEENFVVGTATGYAPFVSINAQGNYEGFDIDVAQALANNIGKKLVIKDLGSMAPLFIALEQETIDAIMWGLSITKERLEKVAMIRYQGETITSYPLLFWQKKPETIKNLSDMNGLAICVEPASTQDAILSTYPFIEKKQTEKIDDALLNIQYGKADAAFVEPAIAQKFQKKYPEIKILEIPLAPEDQVQGIGIAIKKNNAVLIDQVQKAVNELMRDGTIKKYETQWNIS